jgi:NAD-dependent dihydropyrimidine dehydrogenase PreA subunit
MMPVGNRNPQDSSNPSNPSNPSNSGKRTKSDCEAVAARVVPVVDRNRCEDEDLCVAVCPYEVFRISTLSAADRKSLSFFGKLKAVSHGYRQAFVVQPDQCHNCGICVDACPADAIRLVPVVVSGDDSG